MALNIVSLNWSTQTDLNDLKRIKFELEEKLNTECLDGVEAEKVFRLNAEKESLVQFNKKLKTQLRLIKNALVAKQDGGGQQQQRRQHSSSSSSMLDGDWVVVNQNT